jgi:predicted CXXCH cytochrome family protein
MKRIVILVIASWFLAACYGISEAGVSGSDHDMYSEGLGTDPNVCSYCHIPHKAVGDKIWSDWANEWQVDNGPFPGIGNLCYTCHDGTATNTGSDTAFNTALQQHKTSAGSDCDMCHTVHDNTNGNFVGVSKTQSENTESATYCETCHNFSNAGNWGDHLAGSEHPYKDSGSVLDESCDSCHTLHGAVQYTTQELTNPILLADNTNSAYCAACHPAYVQGSTGGNKHPAILSAPGTWGVVDCEVCHDPHQPFEAAHPAILRDTNIDSAYCASCHQATDTSKGPSIGDHTHPVKVAFTTIGLTPSANEIDDNADGTFDYPNDTQVIACESCHSPHLKGVAAGHVRMDNLEGSLCANCHNDKL